MCERSNLLPLQYELHKTKQVRHAMHKTKRIRHAVHKVNTYEGIYRVRLRKRWR